MKDALGAQKYHCTPASIGGKQRRAAFECPTQFFLEHHAGRNYQLIANPHSTHFDLSVFCCCDRETIYKPLVLGYSDLPALQLSIVRVQNSL